MGNKSSKTRPKTKKEKERELRYGSNFKVLMSVINQKIFSKSSKTRPKTKKENEKE